MADDAKALLDSLMGSSRNEVGANARAVETASCWDGRYCPYYCVWGVNVYSLFENTRSDIGVNPRKCSDEARKEWLALPDDQKERHGGEMDLLGFLQSLLDRCDGVIRRNERKLEDDDRSLLRQYDKQMKSVPQMMLQDMCKSMMR